MKLQLQQGSTLEEYKLKDTVPERPYLEVNQNNSVVGYVKLGSSGRSKFTFNNLYIKNLDEKIYLELKKGNILCYDTNFIKQKNVNISSPLGECFSGQNEDKIILTKENNQLYYIDIYKNIAYRFANYNNVIDCVIDDDDFVYIQTNYNIQKFNKENVLIWQLTISDSSYSLAVDKLKNIYIYENNYPNQGLKKINKDGKVIFKKSINGGYPIITQNGIIFSFSNGILNVYNSECVLQYSLELSYSVAIYNKYIGYNNCLFLQGSGNSNSKYYMAKYNYETKSFIYNFRQIDEMLVSKGQGLLDENGYSYCLTGTFRTGEYLNKYSDSGKLIAKIQFDRNNDVKRIAINSEKH